MLVLAAVDGAGAWLWWLGLAVVVLVVIPVVLFVAVEIVRSLVEIRRYSEDILDHGVGLAGALDAVPELGHSRRLSADVGAGFASVAAALARVLGGEDAR